MINILRIKLNSNRIYGLDILRALAILFVVARHFRHLLPKVIDKYSNYIVFDGVTIFFVLSGFLVGGILIKLLNEKKISSKLILNFWIRRWLRTLPNYFFILIILIILNSIFNNNFHAYKYKNYFFFSQNLFSEHPHFFPEAWSLSVEEWFYLLVPIIIYILIKTFNITVNKSVLITVFGVIICVTIFRYIKYSFLTIDEISNLTTIADRTFRKQVFTRIDSLMYGVFGAYLYFYFNYLWNKYKVHFLIIGLVLFVFMKFNFFGSYGSFFYCVFSFSITSLATLLLLPFLNNLKKGKGCFFKFFTYISLISYSMYLINLSIVQTWILGNIEWPLKHDFIGYLFGIIRYGFYWVLTIILSILIYKYFEMPIMNLRERIKIK